MLFLPKMSHERNIRLSASILFAVRWSESVELNEVYESFSAACHRLGIEHVIGLAGGVGENILDHHGIIFFVAFACNVTEMRRAGDIIHLDQRMIGADYRFFFVNIERGHPRTSRSER